MKGGCLEEIDHEGKIKKILYPRDKDRRLKTSTVQAKERSGERHNGGKN